MAAFDAWLVFEDEAGFSMTPPTTRTWSRRGHTPVILVRGRWRRRLSVAALDLLGWRIQPPPETRQQPALHLHLSLRQGRQGHHR